MKNSGHLVVAVLMASSAICKPAQAFIDPITAGTAMSLVSQGLSFGAKPDPQGKEISAILAHVRAMNERLTHIEDQNAETQAMIQQLPQQWRADLKSLLDTIRKEDMQAISEVLKESADTLTYLKPGPSNERDHVEDRIQKAIVDFKEKSRALEKRSGAVAMFMIAAMVQEITIERQQNMPRQTISDILGFYDRYFGRMQQKSSDSLAGLLSQIEADRGPERQKLANRLSKKTDMPLEGEYLFYAATQTKPEKQKTWVRPRGCHPSKNIDAPPCDEPYETEVTVNVPTKTVRHTWKISFDPRKDYSDLGVLQVSEATTEDTGTPSNEQAPNLSGIDKKYDQERDAVQKLIKVLNLRDELIASIRDQETAVAMARTLIADWENGQADALAKRAEGLRNGDLSAMKTEMDELRSSLKLTDDRAKWEEQRRKILAPVQEAETALQDAIKAAANDKWRQEIMHGLAIAQYGLSTYQFVAMHLPKDDEQKAGKDEQSKPAQNQAEKGVDKKAAKPNNAKKPIPDSRIGASSDHRTAEAKFTDAARMLVERAKTMPAEKWKRLPDDAPVLPEALISQALADLDRADQIALVRRIQKPGSQPMTDDELIRSGAEFAAKGEYHKALGVALAPSAAGSPDFDDVGGFRDRNTVRGELLAFEANFAAKRAAQAKVDGGGTQEPKTVTLPRSP
jgi:hypothetical protein